MRRTLCVLTTALVLVRADAAAHQPSFANARVETVAATRGLAATFRDLGGRTSEPFWIGYAAPVTDGEHQMCCHRSDGGSRGNACCAGCRLEPGAGDQRITMPPASGSVRLEGAATFTVLYRLEGGAVGRIRMFSEDCPLDAGGRVIYWLTGVSGADSVRWLTSFLGGDRKLASSATAAMAQHREPLAVDTLVDLARRHGDGRVRGDALFWLAHRAGTRAASAIADAITNDPETDVKRRAVFALSQLPKDEGVPLLIRVARTNRNPEVRKHAMFWLGQSKDARAIEFFEEILRRN